MKETLWRLGATLAMVLTVAVLLSPPTVAYPGIDRISADALVYRVGDYEPNPPGDVDCNNEYGDGVNYTWRDKCEKGADECDEDTITLSLPLPPLVAQALGTNNWSVTVGIGCDGSPKYETPCPMIRSVNVVDTEQGSLTDTGTYTCPQYFKKFCEAQVNLTSKKTLTIPIPPPVPENDVEVTFTLPNPEINCVNNNFTVPDSGRTCPGDGGDDYVLGANCGDQIAPPPPNPQ